MGKSEVGMQMVEMKVSGVRCQDKTNFIIQWWEVSQFNRKRNFEKGNNEYRTRNNECRS